MQYIRLLRHRRVLVLWLAELLSVFGDRFFTLALAWTAWEKSGALALGIVVIAESVPHILIGLFGRRIIARIASFRALARIEAVQIPLVAALPWLWDSLGLAGVLVVIVGIGTADALSDPARAALLPELVPAEQVRPVTGLMDVTGRVTWIVGPGAAAVILTVVATDVLFYIDAATFGVSALALAWLARHAPSLAPVPTTSSDPKATEDAPTARAVAGRHPALAWSVLIDNIGQALYGVTTVGVPVLLATQLDAGPDAYALVITCLGIGSLAGNLLVGNTRLPGRWLTILASSWIVRGLILAGFAAAGNLPVLLILTAAFSVLVPIGDVTLRTRLSLLAGPERLRAMTLYTTGIHVGGMLAMASLPILVSVSPPGAFAACGLLMAASALFLLVLSPKDERRVTSRPGDRDQVLQGEAMPVQQSGPGLGAVDVVDHR
ncbi:MFS transporter [Kineosporia sp. J2-2]|uniref:MFS transporter n=1 Tax=Kineosporia corallincola TaxID=2835133 RepID=A0ABS5TJI2_9ACTN|nr:MFS transporter [Kineosporia corallincola]MBT0771245.1 MFS transporter [Kineosporia corallincola]